jgi:ankyrin repeat protein
LDKGAKVNDADSQGRTALMHAVSSEFFDSVSLLLSKGASTEAEDNEGQTALFRAAMDSDAYEGGISGNYVEVTKLLLAKGANVNAKDLDGRKPLQMARLHGKTELVKLLQEKGAH